MSKQMTTDRTKKFKGTGEWANGNFAAASAEQNAFMNTPGEPDVTGEAKKPGGDNQDVVGSN